MMFSRLASISRAFSVRALQAHDHRQLHAHFLDRLIMPSAIRSQRTMPPKMLTRIALTLSVRQDQLEGRGDPLGGGAAADVEEVRRLAAVQLDQVHGRHREAGAVDHAGDVAIERDVVEVVLAGHCSIVLLAGSRSAAVSPVAEQGVVVDVDLGIQRQQLAVLQ
jgi:hypothetical protein